MFQEWKLTQLYRLKNSTYSFIMRGDVTSTVYQLCYIFCAAVYADCSCFLCVWDFLSVFTSKASWHQGERVYKIPRSVS